MREIKFRQPLFSKGKFSRFHYWGFISDGNFSGPAGELEKAREQSQQFTGLNDKNGKEIYDGDFVIVGLFALNDSKKFGEEPWKHLPDNVSPNDITTIKNTFLIEWTPLHLHNLSVIISDNPDVVGVEVIGNICENPELIA
jgi:uncharacterized phage protein (TIGR01671 family)